MEGVVVRRAIPSDNSCLFNLVGYVMDRDQTKAVELRHAKSDWSKLYLLAKEGEAMALLAVCYEARVLQKLKLYPYPYLYPVPRVKYVKISNSCKHTCTRYHISYPCNIGCLALDKKVGFEHKMMKQRDEELSVIVTSQVWQKSGRCPEGTIPVRRIRKRELLKAHSIDEYGRKKPSFSHRQVGQLNQSIDSFVQLRNHSKAILFAVGYRYLGAKGDIKVCSPFVEKDDEYSTSQVALIHGAYYDFECVEAGWAVNPSVYGDRKTHLFVYWTADGSKKTGCFDLTCPGFVQTSNEIALGAAIYPISIPGGLPYQITIYIYKDLITNNWWVQYGEKTNIGYWPPELFKAIWYNAESVEWGGEVYSTIVGHTPHTKTQMGNGQFASVPDDSSSILKMRIHDNSETLKIPEYVDYYSDEWNCYDVRYLADYVEEPEFYYGGPGRNYMCPWTKGIS